MPLGASLRDEIFLLLRTAPYGQPLEAFSPRPSVGHVYPPFLGIAEKAGVT